MLTKKYTTAPDGLAATVCREYLEDRLYIDICGPLDSSGSFDYSAVYAVADAIDLCEGMSATEVKVFPTFVRINFSIVMDTPWKFLTELLRGFVETAFQCTLIPVSC